MVIKEPKILERRDGGVKQTSAKDRSEICKAPHDGRRLCNMLRAKPDARLDAFNLRLDAFFNVRHHEAKLSVKVACRASCGVHSVFRHQMQIWQILRKRDPWQ